MQLWRQEPLYWQCVYESPLAAHPITDPSGRLSCTAPRQTSTARRGRRFMIGLVAVSLKLRTTRTHTLPRSPPGHFSSVTPIQASCIKFRSVCCPNKENACDPQVQDGYPRCRYNTSESYCSQVRHAQYQEQYTSERASRKYSASGLFQRPTHLAYSHQLHGR